MSDLLTRFQTHLTDTGLIPVGSRVLVAVSGGADSVALLVLLRRVAEPLRLHLAVAHLDHALRAESADDACFVQQLCDVLGVELVIERRDVGACVRDSGGNLEEVARNERRSFLEAAAQRQNCAMIALGHHRDDQAETVLLRLLRGAGPDGLAGMRERAGCFVRPLLVFGRETLRCFLEEARIPWREDASNADQRLSRNRIRHELLPLLQSYNPQVVRRLDELSRICAADAAYWEGQVKEVLVKYLKVEGGGVSVPRVLFQEVPPALAGRLVRAVLAEVRGDLRRIEGRHVAQVLQLAAGDRAQAEIYLPGGWVACRYERLLFAAAAPETEPFAPVQIDGPGLYPLPDGRALRVAIQEASVGENRSTVEFDAEQVTFPLQVRTFRPGDRLRPEGMTGHKKLQDLFVDLKLTREQRAVQPLLVGAGEMLWVIGLRRCRGWSPRPSHPVLCLQVDKS